MMKQNKQLFSPIIYEAIENKPCLVHFQRNGSTHADEHTWLSHHGISTSGIEMHKETYLHEM